MTDSNRAAEASMLLDAELARVAGPGVVVLREALRDDDRATRGLAGALVRAMLAFADEAA